MSDSIEIAIKNGHHSYWDEDAISQGRSGGTICPKCRKWTQPPRKRKNLQTTFMSDCESCEIKDPFRRMWHEFNRICDEEKRNIYNEWLREVRRLLGELALNPDRDSCTTMKLCKLLHKIPFFEGI